VCHNCVTGRRGTRLGHAVVYCDERLTALSKGSHEAVTDDRSYEAPGDDHHKARRLRSPPRAPRGLPRGSQAPIGE